MPLGLFSKASSDEGSRPHRWMQLSVMLDAGMQAATAVKTINKTKHRDNKALARMVKLLERGQSFSSAFKRVGLLSEHELAMVTSAEQAGRVAQGLEHISRDRQKSIEQANALAAALILPKAILIIGGVVACFIRVLQFQQDPGAAVFEVLVLLIFAFAVTQFFLYLWCKDVRAYLSVMWSSQLIRQRSRRFQSHFEYNFYRSLNWQLQSGVAADEAVNRCSTMLSNLDFKKHVDAAVYQLQKGQSIIDSLSSQNLVLSTRMKQTLAVANETGTFEKSISGELTLLKGQIDFRIEQQIKWLPKVFYVLALWFVFSYLI